MECITHIQAAFEKSFVLFFLQRLKKSGKIKRRTDLKTGYGALLFERDMIAILIAHQAADAYRRQSIACSLILLHRMHTVIVITAPLSVRRISKHTAHVVIPF